MIKGIGMDIVEIGRIQELLERKTKFVSRILTDREEDAFYSLNERRRVEFVAGRFAAKEAYAKANGTGIGKELSFRDIEISKDERGKPYFSKPEGTAAHLSITHSREFAAAQVVIEE
ncbi:holo-ACP synthase [Rossellomorea sp. NPDC077527]|uniref:holo-ACP synthase n=1 Tax=Rossellomorea sp. NPDC077527 TaxID=3364510 RepID=UPI0037CBE566